jgi:hypothetical protein
MMNKLHTEQRRTNLPLDVNVLSLKMETEPLAETPLGDNSATFQAPMTFVAISASVRALLESVL